MKGKKGWFILALAIVGLVTAGPTASDAKMKINIGSTYGPDATVHFGQVKFKEMVEQPGKGEMEVQIHVGGAMGGERNVFEGMGTGGLGMGAMGSGDVGIFSPKYMVLEVPYVMGDADHFFKFWNGPVGREGNDMVLKERGVITAGIVYRGPVTLRPKRSSANLKKSKV
jgi:TRAP-type C4-dicarboxylate transport system substrate-binding protein